jgi:pyrroloquinoline quinone (PQQ) biosynthesis protein C
MIIELKAIRKDVDDALRQLPLIQDCLAGQVDVAAYRRYLESIANQYAWHSPKVMCLAASRCINSHWELANYLLKHAAEERGHSIWAQDDLLAQNIPQKAISDAKPVTACTAMIAYTYYLAGTAKPTALYGWMYILEAVGADLGPDAIKGLQQQNLPANFVSGHATADQTHTQEIEDAIKQYFISDEDQADVLDAAKVSADLYVKMFEQAQNAE